MKKENILESIFPYLLHQSKSKKDIDGVYFTGKSNSEKGFHMPHLPLCEIISFRRYYEITFILGFSKLNIFKNNRSINRVRLKQQFIFNVEYGYK